MRTDVSAIKTDIEASLKVIRRALDPVDGSPEDMAICELETFVAIALKVFNKTNPSKIRDEARTVEIYARMNGIPVIENRNERRQFESMHQPA